jgi:hypothetical protein
MNYRGLRIARQGDKVEVNPTATDEDKTELLRQSGEYLPAMASLVAPHAATGTAARILASPYTWGAVSGGRELLKTGDPIRAGVAAAEGYGGAKIAGPVVGKVLGALRGRAGQMAAEAVPAIEKAVGEAAPTAEADIQALVQKMRDPSTPLTGRLAARRALDAAGWKMEATAPAAAEATAASAPAAAPVEQYVAPPPRPTPPFVEDAAPVARKAVPIPAKGNVKPATVYAPTPVQGPKPLTEAQTVLRGRQEEAAKAAGVDIGEAFGTTTNTPPKSGRLALDTDVVTGRKEVPFNSVQGQKYHLADLLDEQKSVRGWIQMHARGYAKEGMPAVQELYKRDDIVTAEIKATEEHIAALGAGMKIAARATPATEQASEGALMTRLRASVMMKKDPIGLVNEVSQKAAELTQSGLSREKVGAAIEELYGLTPAKIKQMTDAVTFAQGLK